MADKTFATLGKQQALKELFGASSYKPYGKSAHRLLLEGIDFNLIYFPLKHLGYKSVLAVSGELYSQLKHPKKLSVVLGVSAKLDYAQIEELWSGITTAATEAGYEDVDLDLVPSKNGLCISVAAEGTVKDETLKNRPAPQSKDLICVSGRLGAAYLGLQVLERERVRFEAGSKKGEELEKFRMLVGAYLKPEFDQKTIVHLEESDLIPSAGYFITNGLSDAVMRLSRDTGFGAKIYADKIPFEAGSFDLGKQLDIDPVSAAMNGGEDYQLLFTIPILKAEQFRKDFQTFDIIGHLAKPEVGTVLVSPDGLEFPLTAQGWAKQE